MEYEPIKKSVKRKRLFIMIFTFVLLILALGTVTYAFYQYTRTGDNNTLKTGRVEFEFTDNNPSIIIGNAFPIDSEDIDVIYERSFTITAYTTLPEGLKYNVYAVYGDNETGKTRLLDDVMSLEFVPVTDGDGFTTTINNYDTAKPLSFVNGKALISTGLVKDTSNLTTKTYKVRMWIDSSKILISSTTKRANNVEGNPSVADTSNGCVTADRYIKNDNNLVSTTLYPADSEYAGKIVYTTNEFRNSFYSIKIAVEAENNE